MPSCMIQFVGQLKDGGRHVKRVDASRRHDWKASARESNGPVHISRVEALALLQLFRLVQWLIPQHLGLEQVQNARAILGASPLVFGVEAKLIDLHGAECVEEAHIKLGEAATTAESKSHLLQPAAGGNDLQGSQQVWVVDEAAVFRQVRHVWLCGIFKDEMDPTKVGPVVANHVDEVAQVKISNLLALGGPEWHARDLGAAEGEPVFAIEDAAAFLVDETASAQKRRAACGVLWLRKVNWFLGHENLAVDVVSKLYSRSVSCVALDRQVTYQQGDGRSLGAVRGQL